jgi:hypothetical protein
MFISDTCKCTAELTVRGFSTPLMKFWAAWLNAHAQCRGDLKHYKVAFDEDKGNVDG